MKFTDLERANRFEVIEWFEEHVNLTREQIGLFGKWYDSSPIYFFKKSKKAKGNFMWRLTIVFFPVYALLLIISLPFNMIITGRWGYGKKVFNFHNKWCQKIGI